MLRTLGLFSAIVAVAYAAGLSKIVSNADDLACRKGFHYYEGLCVYTTDPMAYHYQAAVEECAKVGAFAPSMHSDQDVNFWSTYAGIVLSESHFWLDAYCPTGNQRYAWMDGTPTDYIGPNKEFLQCDPFHGFLMQYNGLDKVKLAEGTAPVVCVYNPAMVAASTVAPTVEDGCPCNASTISVDVVFVVDTSGQMGKDQLAQATSTIQSVLSELTLGTHSFQTNVAVLSYAEDVKTIANFGDLKSAEDIANLILPFYGGPSTKMASSIQRASSMISANARNATRAVIVLLSNSFNAADSMNIRKAANEFYNNYGILIAIDYSVGGTISGIFDIASPGYYLDNAMTDPTIGALTTYALCDANCFCRHELVAVSEPNTRGRTVAQSCYNVETTPRVYYDADKDCKKQGGFVATIHNDQKSFFLTSLYPVKTPYWIGLERNYDTGDFEWADGSTDTFAMWANGNPIHGAEFDCVYAQQMTGFNSPWFSGRCNYSPLNYQYVYACQLRPCSSEYDCSA